MTPLQEPVATLYTVGYQDHTLGSLVQSLVDAGVARPVDVRLNPMSRKRGFSMMQLFHGLERAGIEYEHIRDLGNPTDIRALWKSGELEEGRRAYRALLENGHSTAVDYLLELVSVDPTAILCLEAEAPECHRSVIAEVAQERMPELEVVDL